MLFLPNYQNIEVIHIQVPKSFLTLTQYDIAKFHGTHRCFDDTNFNIKFLLDYIENYRQDVLEKTYTKELLEFYINMKDSPFKQNFEKMYECKDTLGRVYGKYDSYIS